eukprot:Plantae.Rhodophyta-Hildenbrandia_rubra.ctg8291.p1 GENE.Plantae.Rhodophyta-Hildenbrandia_rubra.ctg8291~~Plantae.Rhodophyta-Hildenbrandia_rubra.ctg8291.p1  ORF type:complete len:334 (-),score=59.24 Plantae.Rhodophyta-Hildenbrandia_rubra.ctg8291:806-1807(-)
MARRAELVGQLSSAGLSDDICERYMGTLSTFLMAKMTKIQFEETMTQVLPKDKLQVHNSVVTKLLHRAQESRDHVPELPVLSPARERKGAFRQHSTGGRRPGAKAGGKRKRSDLEIEEDDELVLLPDGSTVPPSQKLRSGAISVNPKSPPAGFDLHSVKGAPGSAAGRRKGGGRGSSKTGRRSRVKEGSASSPATPVTEMPPPLTPGSAVPTHELNASPYWELPWLPAQPGLAFDATLFTKLKDRTKRRCLEKGIVDIDDDAIALLAHAVEIRAKAVMEGGAHSRAARSGYRAYGRSTWLSVEAMDLKSSARGIPGTLGTTFLELERLLIDLC